MRILFLSLLVLGTSFTFSQPAKKAEVVNLGGTKIYYEVHGQGEPLFLLHGFFVSSESWRHFVSEYAKDYTVYLVDLKGHGKSEPFRKKLSITEAAQDLYALIKYLNLSNINGIGVSYGGG